MLPKRGDLMHLKYEGVQCGKQCKGCPHHAYWYGYTRVGDRLRKFYFGKQRPSLDEQIAKLKEKGVQVSSNALGKLVY